MDNKPTVFWLVMNVQSQLCLEAHAVFSVVSNTGQLLPSLAVRLNYVDIKFGFQKVILELQNLNA